LVIVRRDPSALHPRSTVTDHLPLGVWRGLGSFERLLVSCDMASSFLGWGLSASRLAVAAAGRVFSLPRASCHQEENYDKN
jgi:hypothetical protein